MNFQEYLYFKSQVMLDKNAHNSSNFYRTSLKSLIFAICEMESVTGDELEMEKDELWDFMDKLSELIKNSELEDSDDYVPEKINIKIKYMGKYYTIKDLDPELSLGKLREMIASTIDKPLHSFTILDTDKILPSSKDKTTFRELGFVNEGLLTIQDKRRYINLKFTGCEFILKFNINSCMIDIYKHISSVIDHPRTMIHLYTSKGVKLPNTAYLYIHDIDLQDFEEITVVREYDASDIKVVELPKPCEIPKSQSSNTSSPIPELIDIDQLPQAMSNKIHHIIPKIIVAKPIENIITDDTTINDDIKDDDYYGMLGKFEIVDHHE